MYKPTILDLDNGDTIKYVNHWGFHVFSNTPVTGVLSVNSTEWVYEETDYRAVANLSYDSALEYYLGECLGEWRNDHEGDDPDSDTLEELHIQWTEDFNENYESMGGEEYLIGDWTLDPESGLWESIHEGNQGYAAIVDYGHNTIQVVWSEFVTYGALCSPCYPGQVDLDTPGDFPGYDLPIEFYGEYRQNPNPQIAWPRQLPLGLEGGS